MADITATDETHEEHSEITNDPASVAKVKQALKASRVDPKPKSEPKVHRYLDYVCEIKASDLHFKSGARVHVRTKG